MAQFIALLRGINVGNVNRVPMADLRELLTSLGYSNVQTLLNSGNVVFESTPRTAPAKHAARIRAAVNDMMSIDVPVIVKTASEMATIQSECTLANATTEFDPSRLLVAFAQEPETLAELSPLAALAKAPEQFQTGKQAAYLYCANGILQSKAGAALIGKIGRNVTSRNWATVVKIAQLLDA